MTDELLNDLWTSYGNFSYDNYLGDIMKPLVDEYLTTMADTIKSYQSYCES